MVERNPADPAESPSESAAPPKADGAGRVVRTRRRIEQMRSDVIASRSRHLSVDLALDLTVRDISTGGAVLAGAIAFRVFLWTLPATLVAVGLLGFDADGASGIAVDFGLGGVTAEAVGTAAATAQQARWFLVIIGLVLLVSVSRTLAVTVHTAFALTWQVDVRKPRRYLATAGISCGLMIGMLAITAGCSWLRNYSPGLGLGVSIATVVGWTAAWWGASALLPHPPRPWWGLLPGAVLVGVGMTILHVAVVFYLVPRVTSASALYGSLGTAATLLLGAYSCRESSLPRPR